MRSKRFKLSMVMFLLFQIGGTSAFAQSSNEDRVDQAMKVLKSHEAIEKGFKLTVGGVLINFFSRMGYNMTIDVLSQTQGIQSNMLEKINHVFDNKFEELSSKTKFSKHTEFKSAVRLYWQATKAFPGIEKGDMVALVNVGKVSLEFHNEAVKIVELIIKDEPSMVKKAYAEILNPDLPEERANKIMRKYGLTPEGIGSFVNDFGAPSKIAKNYFSTVQKVSAGISILGIGLLGLNVLTKILHKEDPSVGLIERIKHMTWPEVRRLMEDHPELVDLVLGERC